jgi:glycosyltransferase involved in cell wall biosynthesis
MLEGRGIVLPSGTPDEIADALQRIARDPKRYEFSGKQASEWARRYSLEGLREALRTLLEERWNVRLLRNSVQS